MKTCPSCDQTFTDDALTLCPDDGSFLDEAGKKKGGIKWTMFVYLLAVLAAVFVALYYRNTIFPAKNVEVTTAPLPQTTVRFEVTECKSVKDSLTRLEWFVGPDKNVTWQEAQDWVTGLNACGGGWRMPTFDEINHLYDPEKNAGIGYETLPLHTRRPAHMDPIFNAIGSGAMIWSSDTPSGTEASAYDMNRGKQMILAQTNNIYALRAFAVKALQ